MRSRSLFSEYLRPSHGGVVAAAIAVMACALLAGCGYRSEEFRYRMTVEVDTPQGLRTGSSVIEVEVSDPGPNALPEAGINTKVRGEAVAVDLPGGQVLFALLRSPDSVDAASGYAYKAFKPPQFRGDYAFLERTKELKRMRGTGVLPRDDYPMLVTFGDIDDPTSVTLVDPDDLAASFGEGVALRRIVIEMTDASVTEEVARRLRQIGVPPGHSLDNDFIATTKPTLAQSLRYSDFKAGADE